MLLAGGEPLQRPVATLGSQPRAGGCMGLLRLIIG